jgi:hypothetical protein
MIYEGRVAFGTTEHKGERNEAGVCDLRVFDGNKKRVAIFTQDPNDMASIVYWCDDLYKKAKERAKATHIVLYQPAHGKITPERERHCIDRGEKLTPPIAQKLFLMDGSMDSWGHLDYKEITMEDLDRLLDGYAYPEFHSEHPAYVHYLKAY